MIFPKFKIVQTITINKTNQMKCSYSYSCVWGSPYVDMICISLTFPDIQKGLTYNDVSVFWWKIFYLYSIPCDMINDGHKQIIIKYILLKIL